MLYIPVRRQPCRTESWIEARSTCGCALICVNNKLILIRFRFLPLSPEASGLLRRAVQPAVLAGSLARVGSHPG